MEPKKNPEADLERSRGLFMMIGLVVALAVCVGALQYRSYDDSMTDLGNLDVELDDEIIPITQREVKPPPPPPPPPPEIIEVVEDDVELEEELEIESTETDENEEVEVIEAEEEESDEILNFAIVESVPVFPGCEASKNNDEKKACFEQQLTKYVAKKFVFPEMARNMGIGGKVYVQFVIEKDGSISNVVVARGVDKSIDDEAIRVVKSLPKMTPAKQRGKPTRMSFMLPINAKIQ